MHLSLLPILFSCACSTRRLLSCAMPSRDSRALRETSKTCRCGNDRSVDKEVSLFADRDRWQSLTPGHGSAARKGGSVA